MFINSSFVRSLILVPAFALAAGCTADASGATPGGDEESGAPKVGSHALPKIGGRADEMSIESLPLGGRRGGTGGNSWVSIQCPNNLVGISGNYGNYMDSISLTCPNDSTWWVPTSGGPGHGVHSYNLPCPITPDGVQTVIVGLQGKSVTYLDALGVICGDPRDTSKTYSTFPAVVGGSGGFDGHFYEQCPAGMKITRIDVASGSWIDSITPWCDAI